MTTSYETVIGLEVHVQIKTRSKLFCACPTDFGAEPNAQVCPVCTGQPGVLPVLNGKAVEGLVKAALALGCRVNRRSVFSRKQYFYPDLPKAYQISQFDLPLAEHGTLDIASDGKTRSVRIQRIHLEEDAGKLLHAVGSRVLDYSLVDLNRSSVPLMEIVSEPDLRTPEEAADYLQRLRGILRAAGVSDCDMEKGSMRCDANVSIRPLGQEKARHPGRSQEHELFQERPRRRGPRGPAAGSPWSKAAAASSRRPASGTRPPRDPLHALQGAGPRLPLLPGPGPRAGGALRGPDRGLAEGPPRAAGETPRKIPRRLPPASGLRRAPRVRGVLRALLRAVRGLLRLSRAEVAAVVANLMINDLFGRLNEAGKVLEDASVPPESLGALARLVLKGTINSKAAKMVFDEMFAGGGAPEEIVKKKGLVQVEDEGQIKGWVEEVIAANPKIAADVKGGKEAAIGSLVGQVMKKSSGRANPRPSTSSSARPSSTSRPLKSPTCRPE